MYAYVICIIDMFKVFQTSRHSVYMVRPICTHHDVFTCSQTWNYCIAATQPSDVGIHRLAST